MIPIFNQSGVLPPFLPGDNPTNGNAVAPYKVDLFDFVKTFCTSTARINILTGFLEYRLALKRKGIISGFQWVDGSFVENVEKTKGRDPNDIDLITFAPRPQQYATTIDWGSFVQANPVLFTPNETKRQFLCDAYYVDLNLPPEAIVNKTSYWFGLFSHQRDTFLWKGMIELDMQDDEIDSQKFLSRVGEFNAP